jgi:hypothetical protein
MFKANKYTKWYWTIIANPDTSATYTERHHIIPVSMGGGDELTNIARLSARQHFVAHLLLIKMTDGENRDKAISAIRQMRRASKGQKRYVPSGRIYAMIKKLMSKQQSERAKRMWQDPEFRTRHKASTDAYNAKPGATERRRTAAFKGINKPETQVKRAAAVLRRPKHTNETRKKMQETFEKRNGGPGRNRRMTHPLKPNWTVMSPSGQATNLYNLIDFCRANALHQPTLACTVKTQKPSPPLQCRLHRATTERKNTIGWWVIKWE